MQISAKIEILEILDMVLNLRNDFLIGKCIEHYQERLSSISNLVNEAE